MDEYDWYLFDFGIARSLVFLSQQPFSDKPIQNPYRSLMIILL